MPETARADELRARLEAEQKLIDREPAPDSGGRVRIDENHRKVLAVASDYIGQRVRAGDAHHVGGDPFRNHDPIGEYLFSKHHERSLVVRLSGCPVLVQTGIRLTRGRGIATDQEARIAEKEAGIVHAADNSRFRWQFAAGISLPVLSTNYHAP